MTKFNTEQGKTNFIYVSKENEKNNLQAFKPLSPHLTIYKLPLCAYVSIIHRVLYLSLYLFVLCALLGFVYLQINTSSTPEIPQLIKLFKHNILLKLIVFKAGVVYFFHLLQNLRYLAWHINLGYSNTASTRTALLILILTLKFALFLAYKMFFNL